MVKYAYIKVGAPTKSHARQVFFQKIRFQIGYHVFSLNEWEHGFLRGNKRIPHSLQVPFGTFDRRKAFVVQDPDPRIHFCLSCGGKAGGEDVFSGSTLRDELQAAALSFFESAENLEIVDNELHINQVMLWYQSDFDDSNAKLPRSLATLVRDWMPSSCTNRSALIHQLTKYQEGIKVVPLPYDWSVRVQGYSVFQHVNLKNSRKRIHF